MECLKKFLESVSLTLGHHLDRPIGSVVHKPREAELTRGAPSEIPEHNKLYAASDDCMKLAHRATIPLSSDDVYSEGMSCFAPGKIILSGEYAVLFGYAGIAIPSSLGVEAVFEIDPACERVEILAEGRDARSISYTEKIATLAQKDADLRGRLTVHSDLPLGKGMGSSTALIIAVVRALLGDDAREVALQIEDTLNPGHSGLDFATIWGNAPLLFRKGDVPHKIRLQSDLLRESVLIDTGFPSESTTELVAWVRGRESEIREPLKIIGECTQRLASGEPLLDVMRDHHKAQVALGVVPESVQELVAAIEKIGGSAKVIGAGGRTGGAGMVLALGNQQKIMEIANQRRMPASIL